MNGHAWAEARWNWDIRGGASPPGETADLSDVRVTVNPTITVPCWYPPASTIPAEIAKFDVFMRQVARHELTHVEIVQQHARILEQRLKDSNTPSAATWDRITKQVWADEGEAQDAFHASAVGKPIPYP
jgi:predicted secreted Zn-dependent protease